MKPPRTIHSSGALMPRARSASRQPFSRRLACAIGGPPMCAIARRPTSEQVRRRQLADALVVGRARGGISRSDDRRDRSSRGVVPCLVSCCSRSVLPEPCADASDDAVDLPAAQHLELRPLLARILAGAAQQQPVAARAGDRLDARDDLDEERVHQIGNDDAERVGAAEAEAAGHGVALVAELLDLGEDARCWSRR